MKMIINSFSHQIPTKHGKEFHLCCKTTFVHPLPRTVLHHFILNYFDFIQLNP